MSVLIEDRDAYRILWLNRPEKRNALNLQLFRELVDRLIEIKSDPSVRGVIISGKGLAFSAGGDISEMINRFGKAMLAKNRLDNFLNRVVKLIRSIKRPVLAAVNGPCHGAGMVLATACDVVYASDKASFGFSYGNIGLIPEGSYFLARLLGLQKAKELIFSRSVISAQEALALGLITQVYTSDTFYEQVYSCMTSWIQGPVESMGLAKEVLNRAFESGLETQLDFEALAQGVAFTTSEHQEGVAAFLEKRDADFLANLDKP
ncbi:MAG: enoyl-CoA hydratase/isomerase family protein [Candidatus Kariarchaeaceae archaeon]